MSLLCVLCAPAFIAIGLIVVHHTIQTIYATWE